MLSNPKKGQLVRVRYRESMAAKMPLHDKVGYVATPGRGKTRNHVVWIGMVPYSIPAGNLVKEGA